MVFFQHLLLGDVVILLDLEILLAGDKIGTMEEIVNKIAGSGLITLDPADFLPEAADWVVFDLKPFLFRGLILKEKDFREALKALDWNPYRDKIISLQCSADAIIPMWAFMLVTAYLEPLATDIFYGDPADYLRQRTIAGIEALDEETFRDQRVVLKGCGDKEVPPDVYVRLMKKLRPVVKSVMFGEPCSTVPVYKQKM